MTTPPAARPVAVVSHRHFGPYAGAELVAAWIMQDLGRDHDVVLSADQTPDWAEVDARFATDLAARPPRVLPPPPRLLGALRLRHPAAGRLIRLAFEQARLRHVHRTLRPRLWIGSYNECWLPVPGLIYQHHPDRLRLRERERAWSAPKVAAYDALLAAVRVSLLRSAPPASHRIIANSHYTRRVRTSLGIRSHAVVYPPVPPFAAGVPWAEREDRVLMIGRWAPAKRLTLAIDLVAAARRAGAKLRLAFAGFWHATPGQRASIEACAAGHDWIEWHENPTRPELENLAGRSRYGLHAMQAEHFGIAVAELASAGCIVLAPRSGGPPEIIDDPERCFTDAEDGAAKLLGIIRDPARQATLHARARPDALRFAPANFTAAFRRHAEFAAANAANKPVVI
jgi:glycosyltransferase involved in cell wall biosynthesis